MRNGTANGRKRRILVVEDDAVISAAITAYLRAAGYEVDAVDDGLKALRRIRYASPDAIVLDLMLPGTDGWQVIESVRADGVEAAVVVVSARVSERDRVHALRMGADDYLCKPFGMPELVARVESALRRTSGGFQTTNGAIEQPGLVIDSELKRVFVDGEDAGLTVLEFRLLHAMASESGRALTPRPAAPAGVGDAAHQARPLGRRVRPQAAGQARLPLGRHTPTSTPIPVSATASRPSPRRPRRIRRRRQRPPEIRSRLVSSEPQAHAVAEPDSSDAALVDSLLEELGASRVGLLAEFVRAYVRRVPALLVGELETAELAAHVAGLFAFMNERAPGELAVRAYNPATETDGWHSAGSVVEVSVEDSPFLVDTVSTEMHVHGLQVRAVVHPVMGVERSEGRPHRGDHARRGAPRGASRSCTSRPTAASTTTRSSRCATTSCRCSATCAWRCATSCRWWSGSRR